LPGAIGTIKLPERKINGSSYTSNNRNTTFNRKNPLLGVRQPQRPARKRSKRSQRWSAALVTSRKSKSAASLVLMATVEKSPHPKALVKHGEIPCLYSLRWVEPLRDGRRSDRRCRGRVVGGQYPHLLISSIQLAGPTHHRLAASELSTDYTDWSNLVRVAKLNNSMLSKVALRHE